MALLRKQEEIKAWLPNGPTYGWLWTSTNIWCYANSL